MKLIALTLMEEPAHHLRIYDLIKVITIAISVIIHV